MSGWGGPRRAEVVVTDPAGLAFLAWHVARQLSDVTIANRRRTLARLQAWAAGRPLLALDHAALYAWISGRAGQCGASSLVNEISTLQVFYRWCVREGMVDVDPSVRLDRPRTPRRIPRPVGDVGLALATAAGDVDMRVMLALGAFAGLRCVEIARLSWADVHLGQPGHVFVRAGKGSHQRQVPLSVPLRAALEVLPHRVGPVVARRDGQPGHNSAHTLSQRINKHFDAVGVDSTGHKLRHRFGSAVYAATHDILLTQQLLGHASVQTTQQYCRVDVTAAGAAVAAAVEVRIA